MSPGDEQRNASNTLAIFSQAICCGHTGRHDCGGSPSRAGGSWNPEAVCGHRAASVRRWHHPGAAGPAAAAAVAGGALRPAGDMRPAPGLPSAACQARYQRITSKPCCTLQSCVPSVLQCATVSGGSKTPASVLFVCHHRAPAARAMLLTGGHGSGKTMVAQAIAHSVGAALFDLSPRNTDGKWPGKEAAIMVRFDELINCIRYIVGSCESSGEQRHSSCEKLLDTVLRSHEVVNQIYMAAMSCFACNQFHTHCVYMVISPGLLHSTTCMLLPAGAYGGPMRQAAAAVSDIHR